MQKTTTLEFALIGLIGQKPQSGYDLRKTFATTAMAHYSDSPGSIYPALKRLAGRGWIEADQVAIGQAEDPRRRQAYRLTTKGKAALVAWLEVPASRERVRFQQPALMLRFAFMDGNVQRTTVLRFLEDFERELSAYTTELRVTFEAMRKQFPNLTGVFALQSGIVSMEAQTAWARETHALLTEEVH
jgi:DNA-binding PadR family transcriptional regulator